MNYEKMNNSLVLLKLDRTLEGSYKCEVDGDFRVINVRAEPDLSFESDGRKIETSLNVVEGEKISLTCKLDKRIDNDDTKLKWFIGDNANSGQLLESRENLQINYTIGYSSVIEITSASFNDRAFYICEADNGVATRRSYILVRVKDKLAALWPFLGIVGEVVILCTIIFIYEQRRSKADFEESDTDNAENKSPQSSKGQEVRQRK